MSSHASNRGKRRRPAVRAGGERSRRVGAAAHEDAGDSPAEPTPVGPAQEPDEPAAIQRPERRVAARAAGSRNAAASRKAASDVAPIEPAEYGTDADKVPAAERDLLALLREIESNSAGSAASSTAAAVSPAGSAPDPRGRLNSARQLLSSDYYFKQWGRLGMRGRSQEVDDFGLDPTYEARVQPWLDVLYERYFRVGIQGAARVPKEGAALLVCNHAGTLPWDGVVLKTALRHARPGQRGLRWLTDDYVFHSPFLGACLNRIGAVRACPENAVRLLSRGELLAVFPEGIKGIGKLYRERYQLQRFGRGGHIKLALRMGVPLIPLAIVGSEESYPLIYKLRAFSKMLGVPFIPVTPLFPWLGPLGLLPLPSRWHIAVGEPMSELAGLPASAAEDSVLVNDLNEQLRAKVQVLLKDALDARGPAF